MAKMYYSADETMSRLGVNEDQLRGLVRSGKLREFRDAGKLSYRVDEVDKLVSGAGDSTASSSGMLSLADDSGELSLADTGDVSPKVSGGSRGGSAAGGTSIPLDLSSSDTGMLSLEAADEPAKPAPKSGTAQVKSGQSGSGEISLDGTARGSTGGMKLDDSKSGSGSGSADIVSLDEVDKDAVEGMKKDDTVITNIGISVFDDEDLEIAADPMAKTLMTGGDEHLGLDGSGGGSGLLDLTRESDDTSLGAELLEGIDMGDTAEIGGPAPVAQVTDEDTEADAMAEPALEPAVPMMTVSMTSGMVEAASPAFTGLLIGAAIVLLLAGGMAMAVSIDVWPDYLAMLSEQFWMFLGGSLALGGLLALIGWLVGRQPSGPKKPKPPKAAKEKKPKSAKGKKGAAAVAG